MEMAKRLSYVVNVRKGYVTHQGTTDSCIEYVRTVCWQGFAKQSDFIIAESATTRDDTLRRYGWAK